MSGNHSKDCCKVFLITRIYTFQEKSLIKYEKTMLTNIRILGYINLRWRHLGFESILFIWELCN